MSQADILLEHLTVTAHEHNVIDDDQAFIVDPVTRKITTSNPDRFVLVQSDHNSKVFTFKIPRFIEGHDMALCDKVKVLYNNVQANSKDKIFTDGVYETSDLHIIDKNTVACTWTITDNATEYEGTLHFALLFLCMDGPVVTYRWGTDFYDDVVILKKIGSELSFQLMHLDVIEQWKSSVKKEFADYINQTVAGDVAVAKAELNEQLHNDMNARYAEMSKVVNDKHVEIDNQIEAFDDILQRETTNMDNEIDVLKARMDTFTSLPDDSGASDAELTDIRVGTDGKLYGSAGTAVREQFNKTNHIISSVSTKTLMNIDTNLFSGSKKQYNYDTSTFSGWTSHWTMVESVLADAITFSLKARTEDITKVRIRIAVGECKDANVVFDKYMDILVSAGTNQDITCPMPLIFFEKDASVHVAVDANVMCTHCFSDNLGSSQFGYSTYGNMENTMETLGNVTGGTSRLWLVFNSYRFELPDESVTGDKVVNGSISIDKMDFLTCENGTNLFDINTMCEYGCWYYFNNSAEVGNGYLVAKKSHVGTEHYVAISMPVDGLDVVTLSTDKSDLYIYGWYMVDENGIAIEHEIGLTDTTGKLINGKTIEVPEGAKYLYLSGLRFEEIISGKHWFMINAGSEILPYEKYYNEYRIDGTRIITEDEYIVEDNSVTLQLPDKYELVVGDTFELFYKGIVNAANSDMYDIVVQCYKGSAYTKRFIFTPTSSDVGEHILTVELYGLNHNLLDSKEVILSVKNKAASPNKEVVVLYVGDSLAVNGAVPGEFERRLIGTSGAPAPDRLKNISFIGTCSSAHSKHFEGYGGYTLESYIYENERSYMTWINCNHNKTEDDQHSVYSDSNGNTWKLETIETDRIKIIATDLSDSLAETSGKLTWVSGGVNHSDISYNGVDGASENPFWNHELQKIDFANYVANQGKDHLDYVYVLLGWNGIFGDTEETYKSDVRKFIDYILSDFPDCKIVFLGLQIPARDGLGVNYGANGIYSRYYDLLQRVWDLNRWYSDIAKEYPNNVSHVNIAGQFDSEHNHMTGTRTVNARSTTLETYQTNGVHPDYPGYMQIADACYRDFVHKLQE